MNLLLLTKGKVDYNYQPNVSLSEKENYATLTSQIFKVKTYLVNIISLHANILTSQASTVVTDSIKLASLE